MYKVILVDDEALTRDAISKNVPWEKTGFELVGTAENGQEALKLIDECRPDLVLTDIFMPVMDGLALSAHIQQHYPDIKVVIISGYDDFEYAKQAIKYEVANYIIKPITSYELIEELKMIRAKIESSQKRSKEMETAQKSLSENILTLRNHFLNCLIEGDYNKTDIDDKMKQYSISLSGELQKIVMLEAEENVELSNDNTGKSVNLLDFSVANITKELVGICEGVEFFVNTDNKCILVFAADTEERLLNRIKGTCETVIETIFACIRTKVYAIVGETVDNAKKWVYSYQSVKEAKEYAFLFEDQKFVYGQERVSSKSDKQDKFIRQVDYLVLAIKLANTADIESEVANIFEGLRQSGREKKQLLVVVQNLALTILITLEMNASEQVKDYDKEGFILRLGEQKQFRDVEKLFLSFCQELAKQISDMREGDNQKQAIMAMDYIEKNYMNVDISLNKVCEHLCVSTSYFSVIFKNATGETFIEALTRVRMKKAKELLESTSMKNYEIALAVGYQDPHYFSSTFKKHVKATPTEYAKKLQKGRK